MVESQPSKLLVASSILVSRSSFVAVTAQMRFLLFCGRRAHALAGH